MDTGWLKIVFLSLNRNTELAGAVGIMMVHVHAEGIYILMIIAAVFSLTNKEA